MEPKTETSGDLWLRYRSQGLCGLCGNAGVFDTRWVAKSPAGEPAGVLAYCICPNGTRMADREGKNQKPVLSELGERAVAT